MKRINKKGFTLIELLAVIIILGVLLLIAVPSVSKYIQDSRMKTYKNNLEGFASAVANEVNAMDYTSDYNFRTEEILIIPFDAIELEKGSNTKSPFNLYDQKYSFVVVTRKYDSSNNPIGYNYYVQAYDNSGYGAKLALSGETKIEAVSTDALVELPTDGTPTADIDFKGLLTVNSGVTTARVLSK